MSTIFITLQVFLVLILILLILIQKSNDAGIANLASGGNNFSKKRSMSFISKITVFVAALFMINSLVLAKISKLEFDKNRGIIEEAAKETSDAKQHPGDEFEKIPLAIESDVQDKEKPLQTNSKSVSQGAAVSTTNGASKEGRRE